MAATNIGSSKYPLAKIPAMADPADIQVALKYYHWGQETEPETTPAPAGISKYLDELDGRIDTIDTTINNIINKTIVDAKGDLIVGTGDNAVDNLTAGSDGYYLVTDSGQTTGLKWQALPAATTSVAGIVQLSDSTSTTSSILAATPTAVKAVADNSLAKTKGIITSPFERMNVSATAATGTINVNINTSSVWYYTSSATGNFVINVRGDGSTTLDSIMTTGDSITVVFLNTNGSTAYYNTSVQIDGTGTGVTTKWQGGTAPSSGNATSIDAYAYNIIKTASATFTVLASQTKFA
jgi:hypothetical protein